MSPQTGSWFGLSPAILLITVCDVKQVPQLSGLHSHLSEMAMTSLPDAPSPCHTQDRGEDAWVRNYLASCKVPDQEGWGGGSSIAEAGTWDIFLGF